MRSVKRLALMLPLVLVMVLAVACGGGDEPAAPAPAPAVGITAADLKAAIAGIQIPEGLSQADVSKIVTSAAQPGISAADVSKIISDQLAAKPGISVADLQRAVDSAVGKAVAALPTAAPGVTVAQLRSAIAGIQIPEGLSEADVSKIIADAMAAKPGISTADLQKAVDSAMTQAVAVAAATSEAMAAQKGPHGILNVAFPELGAYQAHPALVSFPQASIVELAALESLHGRDLDWNYYPRLMVSWSVASDQLTWTFNLRPEVQFHDNWGEFTAEDFMWTVETASAEGSLNPLANKHRATFLNSKGHFKAIDDYTIEINTVIPLWDALTSVYSPGSDPVLINSKTQGIELEKTMGLDASNELMVGTGPWKIVENKPGEYWLFDAVIDHYLKTPYFAEMKFWEIPEESTRIANFQTRRLDVFTAVPDTIPLLANTPGTEFMAQEGAIDAHLLFYGNYYHSFDPSTCPGQPNYWGDPDKKEFAYCPATGWDPDHPIVSASPDLDSPEWEQARKVRLAMMTAIDKQKLIDELLHGEAVAQGMLAWGNQSEAKPEWQHEYDPALAKKLLTEAGYPDGFKLDLYPAVRGAPAEVEACEAIGAMWEAVGLDVTIIKIPFNTLVEGQVDRSAAGHVVCNAAPPFIEPVWLDYFIHLPDTGWTSGFDHPEYSAIVDAGYKVFDKEERWAYNMEEGQWLWDNAFAYGLWMVNQIHALGPKVGDWGEHLETGNTRRISGLEWAPHR